MRDYLPGVSLWACLWELSLIYVGRSSPLWEAPSPRLGDPELYSKSGGIGIITGKQASKPECMSSFLSIFDYGCNVISYLSLLRL